MAIDPLQTRLAIDVKIGRPLIGCRFDPSGRYLIVSSEDNSLYRYDLLTTKRATFVGHSSWVRGLAFAGTTSKFSAAAIPVSSLAGSLANTTIGLSNPSSTLISGDYNGVIRWWNSATEPPQSTRTVNAHDGWVRAVAISPDQKLLASCGNDHLVKLWAVADGSPIRTLIGHTCHVYNVAFHPNGKTLVSADLKGNVKEWDLATGKAVRDLDAKLFHKYDSGFAADIGGIRGMSFNADGSKLACIGITNVSNAFAGVGNPLVLLFDMNDGKAKQLKPKDAFQGTGWGVNFLSNGWVVGAGGAGQGRIWFWNPDDANNVHTVTVPSNCRDLALHPDGTMLAAAGANGSAFLYTMSPSPTPPKKIEPSKKK